MDVTSCCQRPSPATVPAPGYCPHLQENLYLKSLVHQGFMWYSNTYSRSSQPSYGKSYQQPGGNGGFWKTSPPPAVVNQGSGSNGGYWKTSPSPALRPLCSANEEAYIQKTTNQPKYGLCRQDPPDCSHSQFKQTHPSQFHRWPLEQSSNMQVQHHQSYLQQFQQQNQQERSFQPMHFQQQQPRQCFPHPPNVATAERMPHPAQLQTLERQPRLPDIQEQLEQPSFPPLAPPSQQQQSMQCASRLPRQSEVPQGHTGLEGQRQLLPCQQQQQQQVVSQGRVVSQQQQVVSQGRVVSQQQQQQQVMAQGRVLSQQQQVVSQQQQQVVSQQQQQQVVSQQQQQQQVVSQQQQQQQVVSQQQQQQQQQVVSQGRVLTQQQQQVVSQQRVVSQQLQPSPHHQQKQPPLLSPHNMQQQQQPLHQLQQMQPPHQQLQPPHKLQQRPIQSPQQLQLQPPQQQTQPHHQLQSTHHQKLLNQQHLQQQHLQQQQQHLQQQQHHQQQLQQQKQQLHQQQQQQHHHQQQYHPPQMQQKSSCLLQECRQLADITHKLLRPSVPRIKFVQQVTQEKSPQDSPGHQRICSQSSAEEPLRESCQYEGSSQDHQVQRQQVGEDEGRPSITMQGKAQAFGHDQVGKNTHDSHQRPTSELQRIKMESDPSTTHHNISDITQTPDVDASKFRRQRFSLKYRLGKFARLLGADSPTDRSRSSSPEVKHQPRYTVSCMYSTTSSSSSVTTINPCDTSVNSFIDGEIMSPRDHRETFTRDNDAKDCASNFTSSNSDDGGNQSPNDVFYRSCSVSGTAQTCSSMECPPVTRVSEPESIIVAPVPPEVMTSAGDKSVSNPLTISLTPPPTPPVATQSPPKSGSVINDSVPSEMVDKDVPVCESLSGEHEDIKPVTFTKSFLEAMPALPDHTPALPGPTCVIEVHTAVTPEQSSEVSGHNPAAAEAKSSSSSKHTITYSASLSVVSGVSPTIPQVSPNLPDAIRDGPEVIVISDDTPTVPHTSPDLPEPTNTTMATSMKHRSTTISIATHPTSSTLQVKMQHPQATAPPGVAASDKVPSKTSSCQGKTPEGKGPSGYKFFRNLCIQARFSMYIPPDLEFPCHMCNTSVAGEEALYHLFFGQIQCALCGVVVNTCNDFRNLETFNTTCVKDQRGEHSLLMWSLDPIDFVSYHMRRSLVLKDSTSPGKDSSSPSTSEVVEEMAKFLDKFSVLRQHSPWAQAIRKCWKYVRNMQATSDFTPRVRLKRKQILIDRYEESERSSPSCKTKKAEDGTKEGGVRPRPCRVKRTPTNPPSCQEEKESDKGEENTKRRKEVDTYIDSMMEGEGTTSSGAGEKWFTAESLRRHLETKANLYDTSDCTSHTCLARSPSSVSLTAKELAIARSTRFPDPTPLALLESPEVESEFGDFLLSLPYNHDMLDKIIQYVSVADDKIRHRPMSNREEEESASGSELQTKNTDSPEATRTKLAEEDSKSPESSDSGDSERTSSRLERDRLEPEVPSETAPEGLFVIKETFSLGTRPEESSPEKERYKPMPKSRRKVSDASQDSLEGELRQPAQKGRSETTADREDFIIYRYPSSPCPEECPICYQVLCPSQFILNTVSFVASTTCGGCGIAIYIHQDTVIQHRKGGRRPGPKSKTRNFKHERKCI